jgi:hypothetical protein
MNRSLPSSAHRAGRILGAALSAACLSAVFLTNGCGSASTSVVAPTADKCQISVTTFTGSFGATGGPGTATIATSRDCSWSATADSPWITLSSPTQGQGDGTLSFSVAANQVPAARSGTVTINGQRMALSQEPAPCRYQISPQAQHAVASGAAGTIGVSALGGCAWTAASGAPWVRITSSASGSGTGSVAYTVAANPGGVRSTTITVAGLPFTLDQDAMAAPPPTPDPTPPPVPTPTPTPPPPPGPCKFSVSPLSVSFPATGGTAALLVQVTAGTSCAWKAASDSSWVIATPAAGTGPATVTLAAAANTGAARAATVTVAGATVSVAEDADPVPPDPTVQLSGAASGVSGSCPSVSFTLSGSLVMTSPDTQFAAGSCKNLKNNVQVTVDGTRAASGTVTATRVTFQKGH